MVSVCLEPGRPNTAAEDMNMKYGKESKLHIVQDSNRYGNLNINSIFFMITYSYNETFRLES